MNRIAARPFIVLTILITIASPLLAQPATRPAAPAQRVSPHDTVSRLVQGTYPSGPLVVIVYGRPYSKAPTGNDVRKIWGGLVPYDKVWRTGADEATLFITPIALEMAGKTIPPGTYSLYTLPKADGSAQLIVNKDFGRVGTWYDEKQDLARIDMKKSATDKTIDQFTMAIDPTTPNPPTAFELKMMWENIQYSVPFSVKK